MDKQTETLPSGKIVSREFDDQGRVVKESHTYGMLDIGCIMEFVDGKKVHETYCVKKRACGRAHYEKVRKAYADMPPPDPKLTMAQAEWAALARQEKSQRAAANKRLRENPPSAEQVAAFERQIPFFQAAGRGDLHDLGKLLDEGADPNARVVVTAVESGHTPLYNACVGDKIDAAKLLLERGADPNLRFAYNSSIDGRVERGLSALMFAQSVAMVRTLLDAGADVNAQSDQQVTALARAARRGQAEVVRVLLRAGADKSVRDEQGRSAHDLAADQREFFRQNAAGFKEGHAERRMGEFEEICRILSNPET
jgi:hypothetical protein